MKLTTLAIAALIGVSGQAAAVARTKIFNFPAVAHCQAAMATFDAAFRKRPLGIVNESAVTAFLSCGITAEVTSILGSESVQLRLTNNRETAVDVSCTLMSGPGALFGTTRVLPKTFTLTTGRNFVEWVRAENDGEGFRDANFSCALPPNVEINFMTTTVSTDVGQ